MIMKKLKFLSLAVCAALLVGSTTASASEDESQSEKVTFVSYDLETKEIEYIECDTSFVGETDKPSTYPDEDITIKDQIGSDISPNNIIGVDSFFKILNTENFPYNAICRLRAERTNSNGVKTEAIATGFLIAPDIVVTAGHVLYSRSDGYCRSVEVVPGYNGGSVSYGSYSSKKVVVNKTYYNFGEAYSDYGIIKLTKPVSGEIKKFFTWDTLVDSPNKSVVGVSVNVIGYAGGVKDNRYLWKSGGAIQACDSERIFYDCDTQTNISGAPVMTFSNKVVGIHTHNSDAGFSRGFNSGVRITDNIINSINNLINQI